MPPPDAAALVGPLSAGLEYGLDEACVLKNFLGKDQAQARAMFRGAEYLAEDFMWMAEEGLRYYLPPALEHLQSEESARSWFAHSLLCSTSVQAEWGLPHDLLDLVKRIADYVDANRSKFDLGSDEEEELLRSYLIKIREQSDCGESRHPKVVRFGHPENA
jgi:hypothetical protein